MTIGGDCPTAPLRMMAYHETPGRPKATTQLLAESQLCDALVMSKPIPECAARRVFQ